MRSRRLAAVAVGMAMLAGAMAASGQVLKPSAPAPVAPQPLSAAGPSSAAGGSAIKWHIGSALVEALLRSVQVAPKFTILGNTTQSAGTVQGSPSNQYNTATTAQSSGPARHGAPSQPAQQLEETKLASIPLAALQIAHINDAKGQAVGAQITSPTAVALPNHTIGIYRDDDAAAFPGGMDVINLAAYLRSGFQISKVLLYTAELTNVGCQTVPPGGGQFSTNGSWFVSKPTSAQFSVTWQEDSCAVRSDGPNNPDWGATSIYALDIYVVGPKGEQPLSTMLMAPRPLVPK